MTDERKTAAALAEQPSVVNLTKLAAARSKMTPGAYGTSPHDYASRLTVEAPHFTVARFGLHPLDEHQDQANADGFVATHNAAPALIEAVLAAKDRDAVFDAWRSVTIGHTSSTENERRVMHGCLEDARNRYDAALAKVTL